MAKFPYLLPQKNYSISLIVNHVHVSLSHAGVGSTLTALRQSFWIPSGRQYVKKLLRHCVICRKHGGRPYATPESDPLSKVRVQDVSPFTITGVDFTGALYIKQCNGEESKVYNLSVHMCHIKSSTSRCGDRPFCANVPASIYPLCCSEVITTSNDVRQCHHIHICRRRIN